MTKLLVFDFDGTLCNSFEPFVEVLNELSDDYAFARVSRDEIPSLRELPSREILKRLGIAWYRLPFVVRSARARLGQRLESMTSFPGMADTLEGLRAQGFALGCLSSNSQALVEAFLEREGLRLDFVCCGSSLFGKSRHLRRIARDQLIDTRRDRFLYAGDETRDVQAARDAGVESVAVAWGYNSFAALLREEPAFSCQTPADFLRLL